MSKIHRPPRGLQHLLGSQSFGQNPDELGQVVTPTLDLTSFYSGELLKTESAIGVLGTEGKVAEVTFAAPVAIVAASLESGTPLAGIEEVCMDIRLDGLGGTSQPVVVGASNTVETWQAGAYPTFGVKWDRPLVVPGGASVAGHLTSYAGTALTMTVRVLYVDLNPVADT